MLCVCGVCIPYSSLLPILFVLFRPLWNLISKFFGFEEKKKDKDICGASCSSCPSEKTDSPSEEQSTSLSDPKSSNNLLVFKEDEMNWDDVLASSHTVVCRYTATWCKPCKAVEPIFYKTAEENSQIKFVTVDVDENQELFQQMGILGIPHVQFYVSGELKQSLSGNKVGDLQEVISQLMK
jgi:thioredoxin 1